MIGGRGAGVGFVPKPENRNRAEAARLKIFGPPKRNGPSVNNVRRYINGPNTTPSNWYRHVSKWGYNTGKWVIPAKEAMNKYSSVRNANNLIRVMKRSLSNINPNNAKDNIDREIRKILTANVKKSLSNFV